MVDIKWAKANCSEDLERKWAIQQGAAWLEGMIDARIQKTCQKGERCLYVVPDYLDGRPYVQGGTTRLHIYDEAIQQIADKYREAGYEVTIGNNYERMPQLKIKW